jgi:hypothetical protein
MNAPQRPTVAQSHPDGRAPASRWIAVVGDGTAPGSSGTPEPLEWTTQAALDVDARLIRGLARVPTVSVAATTWDAAPRFAARIQQMRGHAGAVFLTRTDAARARTVQRLVEQAGGPPVLTAEDATAIALAAAALGYLTRLGRDPNHSRIVIAAAVRMPILSPLLIAVGFSDITLWNTADGAWYPLRRAARDADVVIDLSRNDHDDAEEPAATNELYLDRPEGSVITRRGLDSRALATPGLLRALAAQPDPPPLDLRVYAVCAATLAHTTPRNGLTSQQVGRPTPSAAMIADLLAEAVTPHLSPVLTEPEGDRTPRSSDRRADPGPL